MMRMMIVGAAAVLGFAAPAAGQGPLPLSVEVRLDAGIPVGDSGDLYETGVGFGLRGALELTPGFAVYGGYSRFEFDVDDEIVPAGAEREAEGFELGGRVRMDSRYGSADPYLFLGALFHDDETGLEAGLGAEYAVSWELSVTPEVRYRTVDDLDYLTMGLGVRFRF